MNRGYVLVLGATSDIARELSYLLAEEGYNLYIAGRNMELLEATERDIKLRFNVDVKSLYFDARKYETHKEFFRSLNPEPNGVIVSFGYLGNQSIAHEDFSEAEKVIDVNLKGAISILEVVARSFENSGEKDRFIVGISSVAGDRGRGSNYIYGAAKSGFTIYLQGLRNRLCSKGIHVITVKPGFVKTKMTAGLKAPMGLSASPRQVAKDIVKAIKKKKYVIYTPWYWKFIMLIVRSIPESIGCRLKW